MIRLMVDNRYQVYIEPKTKLRLEMSMPFFDSDVIPVPVVYPFNIPIAKNESTFEYAHFDLIGTRVKVFNVTFYFNDLPVFNGKYYIKTISSEYYRGSIIFNSFSEGFSEKKLNELVYEDINIGGTPHDPHDVAVHAEEIVQGHIEADYTFPVIFAENFYGEPDDADLTEYNPDWGGDNGNGVQGRYINNYDPVNGHYPYNVIVEDPLCDNVATLVPCPFIHPLLRKIFSDEGFNSYGAFLDDAELQKLIIFFNYPLDEKYKKYFVRASWDDDQGIAMGGGVLWFPDESNGDNEDADGVWNNSTYRYTIKNEGYHVFSVKLEANAQTYVDPVIARVRLKNELGATLHYEEFIINTNEWLDLSFEVFYYFDGVYIDDTVYLWFEFVKQTGNDHAGSVRNQILVAFNQSYQNLNQYSNILNIANHLPPVEIGTFVNALKKGFGLAVFFDFITKNIEFSFITDILESIAYLDLSDKVLRTNKELEIPENNGYKLDIDFDRDVFTYDNYEYLGEYATVALLPTPTEPNKIAIDKATNTVWMYKKDPDANTFGWFYYSDNIYEVIVGEGKEEITAEFSTLAMHLGKDLLTAQTKVVANSPAFDTGDNDFPLTILFYRGMQPNANADDYPMASCVSHDINGVQIGQYQSKMNGDNGLYAMFLQPWYDFIQEAEEIKRNFLCTALDFLNITALFLPQKGTIKRKIRIENMNCLPKKATFILSRAGVEQCEIILLKSNSASDGGR